MNQSESEGKSSQTKDATLLYCKQCDYTTPKPSNLNRHVNSKHSGNKQTVSNTTEHKSQNKSENTPIESKRQKFHCD